MTDDRSTGDASELVPVLREHLGSDITGTLHLVDRLDRLRDLSQDLLRGIERVTGHPGSWTRILAAVREGHTHPRHIARATGADPDAVEAALTSMARADLVVLRRDDKDRLTEVRIADAGAVLLAQSSSLEIHVANAFIEQLGPDRSAQALEIVEALIAAMEGTDLAGDAERRPGELPAAPQDPPATAS